MVIFWCLPSTKMLFNNHHGHENLNEDHVFWWNHTYYISVPFYKLFVMCHLYASFLRIIGIHIKKTKAASSKRKNICHDSKIHWSIRSVATLHRHNTAQHHQPNKVPLPSKQGQRWTVEHPRFYVNTGSTPTLEVEHCHNFTLNLLGGGKKYPFCKWGRKHKKQW